eukprot:TRINITY_DN4756_c0_g1_i6.p1 TRINITY_DN4756_c0_g1~~TRINITY_DN4756_c0_g1_i6.p1  ORF type:complete len:525 (-),score=156.78 TRINITY_DN4756_c0_g1_i6:79-1653(-)
METQIPQNKAKALKISNKFTTEKLMMMLDKEKLEVLEAEFEAHPEGLPHKKFIWLMKCAMTCKPEEKYDLVHGLCKLFSEIDINGDRKMEWREFAQYVIDAVMENPVKKNAKGELPNQAELLEQINSLKFLRFNESDIVDSASHEGGIQRAIYYPSIDRILLLEIKSHVLKLIGQDIRKKEQVDLYDKGMNLYMDDDDLEEVSGEFQYEMYFALSAAYNEEGRILVCTCSNKTLHMFSLHKTGFKRMKVVKTAGVQYSVWYLPTHKMWLTASKVSEAKPAEHSQLHRIALKHTATKSFDNIAGPNFLNIWTFNSVTATMTLLSTIKAHQAQVMDAVELQAPLSVATCSLDKSIVVWDLHAGKALGVLSPKHITGVRTLDYTADYTGSMISVGHEDHIKVWSCEVALHQAYVGILEGHNTAVACARFMKKSPYVVSIDESLCIRIWDIRTLACLQSISQERKKFDCNGICVIGDQRKFVIYGRKMVMFDTEVNKALSRALKTIDEIYPVKVAFNYYNKVFMVITK